jgi:tetratricopeptide (TPR) repeat protein
MQKLQLVVAFAAMALALPAAGQDTQGPGAELGRPVGPLELLPDARAAPADARTPQSEAERLDSLFAELAEPDRKDWERIESEIVRIWARSGSPAMDLLLARGNEAVKEENLPRAVDHFSALVDNAPGFAEGWNARATTYFLMGNFALAMADVEHVLVLNPRHFGALTGLSAMLEAMDEPELALKAMRMAEALTPNRPTVREAIVRLEKLTGDVEL